MPAGTPSRFPRGLNNVFPQDRLNLYGLPDPTKWITFFTDFTGVSDSLPNATDANFTVTKTGAGTIAQTDGAGGLSLLTNAAADNDAVFVQKRGEAFRWSPLKRMVFAARFMVSDATETDVVMGLQITDTTPLDVTDGIFFLKADGSAVLNFFLEKDNAAVSVAATTMVTSTMVEVAFSYNGRPFKNASGVTSYTFDVYVNNNYVTSLTGTTTVCDDEDLCVSFGVQNGEAVAKTETIDWILAAVER